MSRKSFELELSHELIKLERHFVSGTKLSLIARHPTNPECHLVVTSDELSELRKVCELMEGRENG